ncbi:MAG: carboxypeptidase regulatory-like domain-containing protein [bacterium]|nr:carboxypeptidase regulatory-like domain-containing protein [bacterium]
MSAASLFRKFLLTAMTIAALAFVVGCDGDSEENNNNNNAGGFPTELVGTWLAKLDATQIGASAYTGGLSSDNGQLIIRSDATWRHSSVDNGITYADAGHARWIAPSTLVIYLDTVATGSDMSVGDSVYLTTYYTNEVLVVGMPSEANASYLNWELYGKQGLSMGVIAGICVNPARATLGNVPITAALPNSTAVRDTTNAYGFFYFSSLTNGTYTVSGTYNGITETRTVQIAPGVISPMMLTFTGGTVTTGSITGRVFNSNDSTALSGVTITPDGGSAATTDANGDYTITGLTTGMRFFTITKTGYLDSYAAVFITANQTITQNFFLAPTNAGPGTVTGEVRDAVSGDAISGATVAAENGQQTTTNASGQYTLTVSAGTRAISAAKTGYYGSNATLIRVVTGQTYTQNFTLSPEITGGSGQMRLVLRWATTPRDLDSYLRVPGVSTPVYYGSHGDSTASPFARLDVDDTSGEGPETITIYQFLTGTYQYYIHNYSGSPDITASGAVAMIYGDGGLLQQFTIPTTPSSGMRYWYICDIDGATGAITVHNTLQSAAPTGPDGKQPLLMAKKY